MQVEIRIIVSAEGKSGTACTNLEIPDSNLLWTHGSGVEYEHTHDSLIGLAARAAVELACRNLRVKE